MPLLPRLSKTNLIAVVAERTGHAPALVEEILDAVLDTLYAAFERGQSVTLQNFGGFYVRPEAETWVFKFNPAQRLRALFGWSSTAKGKK